MQRFNTNKLFFGKYPYKILLSRIKRNNLNDETWLSGWTPTKCYKWLKNNKIEYRNYTKLTRNKKNTNDVIVFLSIFVEDEDNFNKIIDQFKDNVSSVTQPANDTHVDILKDNTSVVIRNSLLYKRFRYVVCFTTKYHYIQQIEVDGLNAWISENFLKDTQEGEVKWDRFKWHQMGWNPRLYLSDEADLVLVKLTWAERIRSITIVRTFDELKDTANNP